MTEVESTTSPHRVCPSCGEDKPESQYTSNRQERCTACIHAEKQEREKKAREERKARNLEKKRKAKAKLAANAGKAYRSKAQTKARAEKRSFEEKVKAEEQRLVKEAARARLRHAKEQRARNEAERELASRVLARRSLLHFTQKFNDKYDAGWVHELICAKLDKFSQDVADKKSPRLLIFMPPRAGKSELASKNFPAQHLGRHPDHEIIASSYAVSLPMKFSRAIKSMIAEPAYQAMFPETKLDPNAQATEGWYTTKGGGYLPAGVGGGITGKGAHVFIIDDPVKDAEEADSETQREKVWDWWDSTAETRLAPGAGVLGIQTRWNDDDLSGRFLRQMNEAIKEVQEERETLQQQKLNREIDDVSYQREINRLDRYEEEITNWEVLTFPALATEDEWLEADTLRVCYEPEVREAIGDEAYDDMVAYRQNEAFEKRTSNRTELTEGGFKLLRVKDEALHPTRFDELHFRKKKRGSQPRFWSAMYQQNPVPEEGVYFTKSDFRFEPVVADYRLMRVYAAFDMAIGQKQTNDWTVGLIGGHDYDDRLHILNMIRVRTDKLAELIMDSVTPYKDVLAALGLEQGQIQMAVMPSLQREMSRRRIFLPMDDSLRPITDKLARARPAQAWMQQGRIILPSNQPWIEQFQMELLRFPGGLHDDIIDALAWLVRMVMKNQPPKKPVKRGQPKSWKDKLNGMTNNGRGEGALVA